MVGRQLPLFSLIVPFWLIWAYAGFRGMLEVWPAVLVAGVSFAVPQFLVSNFHGPWLVDIVASVVSMAALGGVPSRLAAGDAVGGHDAAAGHADAAGVGSGAAGRRATDPRQRLTTPTRDAAAHARICRGSC